MHHLAAVKSGAEANCPPVLTTVFFVVAGLLHLGCGVTNKALAPASQGQPAQPKLLTVSKEQIVHLTILPVRTATWSIIVHTTGTVDWDADHTTQAITQVNGPISRILVDYGSRAAAGAPLLYVSSPDMANAISTYRKARNREE